MYARVFDDACNPGSTIPESVGAVEWTAALGGTGNPHKFEAHNFALERDVAISVRGSLASALAKPPSDAGMGPLTSTDWTVAVQHAAFHGNGGDRARDLGEDLRVVVSVPAEEQDVVM